MLDFSQEQWQSVKEISKRWWQGDLERPIIQVRLEGKKPKRPKPELPLYVFDSFHDLAIPAETIVDRLDYHLQSTLYMGDAFPQYWPNFGPGVMAAILGASLQNGLGTVWFHPPDEREIGEIYFSIDTNNVWYQRILSLIQAASKRWQGTVQIGMTDLGGNLDILSAFRPGEKLIYDLYDQPQQVERLLEKAHALWWECFEQMHALTTPDNPGYSCWTPLYSEQSYYMLQCDFSYMLNPHLFDSFVKPELVASANKLGNAFYHLDGPGQLPHLDSILGIKAIKGVQWIPGAGQPDVSQWPWVYQKILGANKLTQIFNHQCHDDLDFLDQLADQLGTLKNVAYIYQGHISQEKKMEKLLLKYGALK
ncbi:hypothetical protein GF407_17390 [candidate division KSB1 bacterium]|nr:hypothetical protein [candidate division KSB1 bacterium]